jgi:hypothetical protein
LNDVSYGFTQAARTMTNVPFQVVRKFDTEKIHNFEIFINIFFILMTLRNIIWSGHIYVS